MSYMKPETRRAAEKAVHRTAHFVAGSSLPAIFLITSLLLARYLQNSDFSYPTEIILPIALFSVLATIFFYIYKLVFRGRNFPAHIASLLLIYATYSFSYTFPYVQKWTEAILPSSLTTSFSTTFTRLLVLAVLFGLLAYAVDWLFRRVKQLRRLPVYKVLLFAVCFIFAVQAVKVSARLWTIKDQWAYHYSANLPQKPAASPASGTGNSSSNQANGDSDSSTGATANIGTDEKNEVLQNLDGNGNASGAGSTNGGDSAGAAAPTPAPVVPATKPAKPNVYYLLFDRYASADTLQRVYHYDNTPLLDFLNSQGFVNRQPVAYSNYPFTQQSVSSTLAMSYLSGLEQQFKNNGGSMQTAFPYRSIISDPPVAQVFKQNGYQYNQLSSWWDFTRVGVKADNDPVKSFRLRILGMTFWLTDLQRDILHKSALSQLLQKGITIGHLSLLKYDQDRNPRQNFADQLDAVRNIAGSSGRQQKPQFTFAHILSPHDPYLFAADGSDAPYNGDRTDQDIDEYIKYTNQLTYANTQITKLIADVRGKDPDAVVIIQADEGPYPKDFRGTLSENSYFDPKNLDDSPMRQKFGIMASYYMPGLDQEQVRQQLTSSVNVFPFVLDNYLGYDIKYLPECNWSAGNKFHLYDFTLLTGRLQGSQDPDDCGQYDR